jgi:hypothetical protein
MLSALIWLCLRILVQQVQVPAADNNFPLSHLKARVQWVGQDGNSYQLARCFGCRTVLIVREPARPVFT